MIYCEKAGLTDVFIGNGTMRGGHPGCFPVEIEMCNRIDFALTEWQRHHPNAKAIYEGDGEIEENKVLCWLEWLNYWVNWAMKNCKIPVVANT